MSFSTVWFPHTYHFSVWLPFRNGWINRKEPYFIEWFTICIHQCGVFWNKKNSGIGNQYYRYSYLVARNKKRKSSVTIWAPDLSSSTTFPAKEKPPLIDGDWGIFHSRENTGGHHKQKFPMIFPDRENQHSCWSNHQKSISFNDFPLIFPVKLPFRRDFPMIFPVKASFCRGSSRDFPRSPGPRHAKPSSAQSLAAEAPLRAGE